MTNHAETVLCTSLDFHYHNSQNQLTSFKLFPVQFRLYSQISRRNNAEIRPGSSKNSSRRRTNVQRVTDDELVCAMYVTRLYADDAVVAGRRRPRGRRRLALLVVPVDLVHQPPRLLDRLRGPVGDERVQRRHQARQLAQQRQHPVAAVPAQRRKQRRAVLLGGPRRRLAEEVHEPGHQLRARRDGARRPDAPRSSRAARRRPGRGRRLRRRRRRLGSPAAGPRARPRAGQHHPAVRAGRGGARKVGRRAGRAAAKGGATS